MSGKHAHRPSRRPRWMLAVSCVLVLGIMLLAGPARHLPTPATVAQAARQESWSGPHTGAGYNLNSLWKGIPWENWVVNGNFTETSSSTPAPGWKISTGSSKATVRQIHLFNTPSWHRAMEIVPPDGHEVSLTQSIDTPRTSEISLAFSAHALSTQGDARVVVAMADSSEHVLATVGWVLVGRVPPTTGTDVWFDHRQRANYLGGELLDVSSLSSILENLPNVDPSKLGSVSITFYVADGQHMIIDGVYLGSASYQDIREAVSQAREAQDGNGPDSPFYYIADGQGGNTGTAPSSTASTQEAESTLSLQVSSSASEVTMGETFMVTARISQQGSEAQGPLTVTFDEPKGFGLITDDPITVDIPSLDPGESTSVTWTVKGQRPHTVNLGRPWQYQISVGDDSGLLLQKSSEMRVVDPTPGQLYYVLTEDLEPMDSAGYPTRFTGNRNAWLDPEEYRVQLIEKATAMDRIAERYGAKWTHFVAWPAVLGAEWAARQSDTGQWEKVISDIRQSISEEAARGHQYAPHLHMDYEYRISDFVQSYDEVTDGYWANHREHGWVHQIDRLGDFDELNSRTGLLFDYISSIEELTDGSQGQIVSTRIGSFDFGDSPSDQRKSVEAFRRVGLLASSDAGGNTGGSTSANYGENIYFSRPDSINRRAADLDELGIVQSLPTPRRPLMLEGESVSSANQKVDQAVRFFTAGNRMSPGVHGIMNFSHAMFMLGDGGWKSTTGGAFEVLDKHLAYVYDKYVQSGQLVFATSDELTLAWLDYYTPQLLAVRGPLKSADEGWLEYPIRLVGRDIPLGGRYRHQVTVKYPLSLRDKATVVEIRKNGETIERVAQLPTAYNDISFIVDGEGSYTMRVLAPTGQ